MVTQKDLAEKIGIGQDTLGNYKTLQKLTPELQELVQEGKIGFTTAVKVWGKICLKTYCATYTPLP